MEEWKYIEKSNNELEVSNTGKIRNSKSNFGEFAPQRNLFEKYGI